jgi:4-hydroxy-tetrahydrodipicolinate reductase
MMEEVKIVIAGARGRMGSEAVKLVEKTSHYTLVAVVDHKHEGKSLKELDGFDVDVPIYTDIDKCFFETNPDVLIDLTTPEIGKIHTKKALLNGVRPVVGTTGFSEADLNELQELTAEKGIGAIIAPNFAIGAILIMKF